MEITNHNHDAAFKAQMAFVAFAGDQTIGKLTLMRRIDGLRLDRSHAGVHTLRDLLRGDDKAIRPKRVSPPVYTDGNGPRS